MSQQTQYTGFIHLPPLQFEEIRQCGKCIHGRALSRPCMNRLVVLDALIFCARVQTNYNMNLDLTDKLTEGCWSHCFCVTTSVWISRVLMGISSLLLTVTPLICNSLTTLWRTC